MVKEDEPVPKDMNATGRGDATAAAEGRMEAPTHISNLNAMANALANAACREDQPDIVKINEYQPLLKDFLESYKNS